MNATSSGSMKHVGFAVLMLCFVADLRRAHSDEPAFIAMQHSIPVATLDVEKVFKKSQRHNAVMAPIKARLNELSNRTRRNDALCNEQTKLYGESFQRMSDVVTRICKAKDIGIVIRAKLDSTDASERSSILEYVNRPVVYSNIPDITDQVIAELDR